MAAELNRNYIKRGIAEILKNNSSLYDDTGADSKIRTILVGRPEDELNDRGMPYIFIRNTSGSFETIKQQNFTLASVSKIIEHDLMFSIICVVNEKNSREAEKRLDNFQELILESIDDNHHLLNGVSAWATTTSYVVDDLIIQNNLGYICLEAHTSGTFATDLAAGKWGEYSVDSIESTNISDYPLPTIVTGKQGRIINVKCLKVTAEMGDLGALSDLVLNKQCYMELSGNQYIAIEELRPSRLLFDEVIHDTSGAQVPDMVGGAEEFMTVVLKFTATEYSSFHTSSTPSSEGIMSGSDNIIVKAVSRGGTTTTITIPGYIKNIDGPIKTRGQDYVTVELFIRITGGFSLS